jgi:glycine/D-amino acid oxidase-like deaminating enzyme
VLVIEAARLAAAASGGAAGALAPERHQLSDPPAFMALARASPALYRQLDHDWDRALGLQWTPGLLLLPEGPPAGGPWPGVELLNSDQVAELVPELVPMPAGLLAHDQARVHPSRLAAARFRPATGDGQPVIDRVPGLDNAWVSAGHDGTGLLMAPATGQALATWITTS